MDRTSEFFSIVDQRRSQQSIVHPPRPPITRSEFTAEASEIGAAIYATAEKLGKLTQLAKSKSLFEDPTAEINAMTALIKTEIVSLNSKLAELKGRQLASRTKQRESHSTSVVESLSSQLRGATRDFQDVLHTRSANIKLLQDQQAPVKTMVNLGCEFYAQARMCVLLSLCRPNLRSRVPNCARQ